MDQAAAGFSPYWIGEQLRSQIGSDGAVFCDDLSMKATEGYGGMPQRARVALDAGCDMVLVCNDRQGAARTVASLADYSNPLSLVRLARLHGTGHILRETLLASDVWATASNTLQRWLDRPVLELDA